MCGVVVECGMSVSCWYVYVFFFFFKQKTAYEMLRSLVGSEMCIRDRIYRVDYGYLKDTSSMDDGGIDVWLGSGKKEIDSIMCIVDLRKRDSEIKLLIGCTEEDKVR